MQPLTFANLRTVLCLGCHADDIEIGCGGAVLRLLREHPELRHYYTQKYEEALAQFGIPYTKVSGNQQQRLAQCVQVLEELS